MSSAGAPSLIHGWAFGRPRNNQSESPFTSPQGTDAPVAQLLAAWEQIYQDFRAKSEICWLQKQTAGEWAALLWICLIFNMFTNPLTPPNTIKTLRRVMAEVLFVRQADFPLWALTGFWMVKTQTFFSGFKTDTFILSRSDVQPVATNSQCR